MIKQLLEILTSAARIITENTGTIDVSGFDELSLYLSVTVASGTTPTLDVVVEDSPDGDVWHTLSTFTQATGVTTEVKRITNFGRFIKVTSTIGGTTPSFTYDLKGVGKNH